MLTRISVVGAPESGKSAFALALKDGIERADLDCLECVTPVAVVDDYAEDVGVSQDCVIGFEADYVTNLAVALERRGAERRAFNFDNAKTVITVGSVLETSTYAAMAFEDRTAVVAEDEDIMENRRIEAVIKILACLYMDTFRPDHAFYLPPLKGGEKEEIRTFDRNLQAAFQAFELVPITPLLVEDGNIFDITERRVDEALEIIFKEEHAEGPAPGDDAQAEVADGPGVRES